MPETWVVCYSWIHSHCYTVDPNETTGSYFAVLIFDQVMILGIRTRQVRNPFAQFPDRNWTNKYNLGHQRHILATNNRAQFIHTCGICGVDECKWLHHRHSSL